MVEATHEVENLLCQSIAGTAGLRITIREMADDGGFSFVWEKSVNGKR